jgi:hypothetical protein
MHAWMYARHNVRVFDSISLLSESHSDEMFMHVENSLCMLRIAYVCYLVTENKPPINT